MSTAILLFAAIVVAVVVLALIFRRRHDSAIAVESQIEPAAAAEIRREPETAAAARHERDAARDLAGDHPPADAPRQSERYALQRLRILVVDDNPLVGSAIARLLDAHKVTTAPSGQAALTALDLDDNFDAILYAATMRGMPGAAFLTALAGRHPDLRARVALLLGSATPETLRLLALSEVRWVTKPLRYAQLAVCVSELAALRGRFIEPANDSAPEVAAEPAA
jgi:CheY-like chemotaxis protein